MDGFNPDILRTMQQALELSKMFGEGAQSETNGEQIIKGNDAGNAEDNEVKKNTIGDSMEDITGKTTEAPAEDRMKQIIDMFRLMQTIQGMASPPSRAPSPANSPKLQQHIPRPPQLDDEIHTPAINSIKAAIPYLDSRHRRYMGIFVKLIEIQRMMELYSQAAVSMCGGGSGNWQRKMLEALITHVDEDKANKIELLLRMMDVKEIADRM